jgi:hypothetical protein
LRAPVNRSGELPQAAGKPRPYSSRPLRNSSSTRISSGASALVPRSDSWGPARASAAPNG